jgi:hypothetical protein
MILLGVFIMIWAVLTGANYLVGLAVESMIGSGASLLSFLVLFFGSVIVSWLAAVRLTKPKEITAA